MATAMKSGATPANVNQVQATLYRFEALQEAIQVETARDKRPIPGYRQWKSGA